VIQLDIRADVAGATASLKALDIEVKRMAQKLLRALATIAKKRIKKRMAGYLHTRTGELQKAVYGFSRSPSHAVVSAGQRWKAPRSSPANDSTSPSWATTASTAASPR
jgi:hypothetical protein